MLCVKRCLPFAGALVAALSSTRAFASETVGNPGEVVWTIEAGSSIQVGALGPFEVSDGPEKASFSGTVGPDGTLTWALERDFEPIKQRVAGVDFTVRIILVEDASGAIDPQTGVLKATVAFRISITGSAPFFPDRCEIPKFTLRMSSDGRGASAYDDKTGTVTLVEDEFELPAARNCGIYTGLINSQLALPSTRGKNVLKLVLTASPVPVGPVSPEDEQGTPEL